MADNDEAMNIAMKYTNNGDSDNDTRSTSDQSESLKHKIMKQTSDESLKALLAQISTDDSPDTEYDGEKTNENTEQTPIP